VRMRRVVICGCGSGISSNDLVGPGFVQPMPVQHDLKTAEVDFFQHHLIRRDRDEMPLDTDGDLVELGRDRVEISQDVANGRRTPVSHRDRSTLVIVQCGCDTLNGRRQSRFHATHGGEQVSATGFLDQASQSVTFTP